MILVAGVVVIGIDVFVVTGVVGVVVVVFTGDVVMKETDDLPIVDEINSVDRLEIEKLDDTEELPAIEGEDALAVVV